MAKYTQVRADTFQTIQINAGVILNAFDPATGAYNKTNIVGATTGGNSFSSNPTFSDYFADVDNVPENTKQGKRIEYYDPALSTNFVTIDNALGKKLITAADADGENANHIIPRNALNDADFGDLWLVGDYSDKNGTANGGFVAIHIKDALNTGGFQFKSTKNGKGQFSADFHGHYDIENIDNVPFDIYIVAGKDDKSIKVVHSPIDAEVSVDATAEFWCNVEHTDSSSHSNILYQWQVQSVGDENYTDISGETGPVLRVHNVTRLMNGNKYRCKCQDAETLDIVITGAGVLTVNISV
jgi:hypothetical protein